VHGARLSRRDLLSGAAAAFAFRPETIRILEGLCAEQGAPEDEEFWLRIRAQFDVDPDLIVFNHAGLSPSPIVVREAIAAQTKRANSDPSFHIWRRQDNELDPIRKRLAALVGCQEDELALVPNCTYGLQTGIMGVPMSPGDEVLTTTHDYPRAFTAMRQRERREGTSFKSVPIAAPPESQAKIAKDILDQLTSKTKLILLSQMTFVGGQLMPVKQVSNALKERTFPIFSDGAHGIGLLPEKFSEMGADIYAACLHKWLMGPVGTGVFLIRKPWIGKIWPLHPADPDLDHSMKKFEQVGTRPAAPFLALKETLDFHEMIGLERKRSRLNELRNALGEKIFGHPKIRNFGSLDPRICQAVALVGIEGMSAIAVANELHAKYRIHVTTMVRAGVDAIRVSPNVFTTKQEIETLAAALIALAGT
jgi:selenocysteine lyase/cysteine desulfurase